MAAKHHSRSRRAQVEYAAGVVKVEELWEDVYIGDVEALIAAGLARRDEFPGEPGRGATMATYDVAGNPVPQGSNYGNGRVYAGRRQITRRGANRFGVGVAIDNGLHAFRLQVVRKAMRTSNVVQLFGIRGIVDDAPASSPMPLAGKPRRRPPTRNAADQQDAQTPTPKMLGCLADACALLRVLAEACEVALNHKALERHQGACRVTLRLLTDALELVDSHLGDHPARMTIYDAAGVVDALEGACFQTMGVPLSEDPGACLAGADVAACARLAARLAGEAAGLLQCDCRPE